MYKCNIGSLYSVQCTTPVALNNQHSGNRLLYKTFKHHELPLIAVYEKEIELHFNNFADSIQQFKLSTVAKVTENETDEDLEKDPVVGVYKGR